MRVWKNYGCINGTELARKRKRRIGGIVPCSTFKHTFFSLIWQIDLKSSYTRI